MYEYFGSEGEFLTIVNWSGIQSNIVSRLFGHLDLQEGAQVWDEVPYHESNIEAVKVESQFLLTRKCRDIGYPKHLAKEKSSSITIFMTKEIYL